MLHQVLGNGVLLNMGIRISGPIPILLLAAIGQTGKAGFHLVGKVIHMITSRYGARVGGPKYYAFNLILRLFLYHFLHTMSS
jgi:hypothetical protein